MPEPGSNAVFATTHWSVVLAAGHSSVPGAPEALEKLCHTYWYPLYAYVRRRGYSAEDAQDLTQGFFTRLLARNDLAQVSRDKGRFRSFLLAALNHFLANEYDRTQATKRGGGQAMLSLDEQDAEGRYVLEPATEATPEKGFDRRWALAVMDEALCQLQRELAAAGKTRHFDRLKPFLSDETDAGDYEPVASELGISVGAVRMAVSRLRQRYGELVREVVANTVSTEAEIDDELRYLIELACQS